MKRKIKTLNQLIDLPRNMSSPSFRNVINISLNERIKGNENRYSERNTRPIFAVILIYFILTLSLIHI